TQSCSASRGENQILFPATRSIRRGRPHGSGAPATTSRYRDRRAHSTWRLSHMERWQMLFPCFAICALDARIGGAVSGLQSRLSAGFPPDYLFRVLAAQAQGATIRLAHHHGLRLLFFLEL